MGLGKMAIFVNKHYDWQSDKLKQDLGPERHELLSTALFDSYRSALAAMASFGAQACPALGGDLQAPLSAVRESLSEKVSPEAVKEAETRVEEHLQRWGKLFSDYFKQKTNEVKDLLLLLAQTAESAGERDQRYARQFEGVRAGLQAIADLEDLSKVRASLVKSMAEIETCVDKMTQEGGDLVTRLQTQLVAYQSKLEAVETKLETVEQQATHDTLTGLYNRHSLEIHLQKHISQQRPFSVVVLDLNGFKQVNDAHGHLAGDELLKQFASQLRSTSRTADVICRWGGDEFVVIMNCGLSVAKRYLTRVQCVVFGTYTLRLGETSYAVKVDAAAGVAEWQPGETMQQLLGRADTEMYKDKAAKRGVRNP